MPRGEKTTLSKALDKLERGDRVSFTMNGVRKTGRIWDKEGISCIVSLDNGGREKVIASKLSKENETMEEQKEKYRFQENDLVICCPEERTPQNADFEIYARVVEVDRENDVLKLDCYKKQGRLRSTGNDGSELRTLRLENAEKEGYYQLQNDDDVYAFNEGLLALSTCTKNTEVFCDTLNTVSEAVEAINEVCHDNSERDL